VVAQADEAAEQPEIDNHPESQSRECTLNDAQKIYRQLEAGTMALITRK
jgi:hypothetical protein